MAAFETKNYISNSVIRRLPRYYRFLEDLEKNGYVRISSRELSEKMGLTASQIRQDFNCFGGFGQQGYGYKVSDLRAEIKKILGLDSGKPIILLGAGNLGRAVASHIDFQNKGFELIGAFDTDPAKIGEEIGCVTVQDSANIEEFCAEKKPVAAILCIPGSAAEQTVEKLIGCGIRAFWNFTHFDLFLAYDDVAVENVHLGDSLTTLSYRLNSGRKDRRI